MSKRQKVSVVISAYNEARRIEKCLRSVSWADEIVVVDNTSVDKTAEKAKKHGAIVFTRPNNPMLNVNKNYGFAKAKGPWILNLDADEQVTPELTKEILKILETSSDKQSVVGYRIPRKNIIFGKWIQHAGWYPDYNLRLFQKEKGTFAEKHVHEQIEIEGERGKLECPILHDNYHSVSQFVNKMNAYTDNEAENVLKNGYTFSGLDAIRYPKEEFFRRYFAQDGYKDGFHGFVLSLAMSMYHFVLFLKLWEHTKFQDPPETSKSLEKEISKSYREYLHWLNQTGQQTLSFFRRALIKLGL